MKKVGWKGALLNLNQLFSDGYVDDTFIIFKCQKHFNHHLSITWTLDIKKMRFTLFLHRQIQTSYKFMGLWLGLGPVRL